MADTIVMRDTFPNFSGMLFQKGVTRTPFSTLIGAAPRTVNSNTFSCGVYYDAPAGAQPEITEAASITAPDSIATARTQDKNYTQIFHYAVNVSYAKESNMGSMSGINIAGDVANPPDELAFQVARVMDKAAMDIEYSFIRGTKQEATSSAVAGKTGGVLEAITTNVVQATTDTTPVALTYWKVAEAIEKIHEQGGDTSNLVLGVSAPAMLQLNKDASENQYMQGVIEMAGLNLQTVITPLGQVAVVLIDSLNDTASAGSNSAIIFNPSLMHPVFQPVPNKGNFFLEPLAKTGASDRFQIFGQVGLDYGPEYMAAKITNISNDLPSGTL